MPEDVSQDEIDAAERIMGAGNISGIDDVNYDTGEVNPSTVILEAEIIEKEPEPEPIGCEGCACMLEPFENKGKLWQPEEWAEETKKRTGKIMCVNCFITWQKEQKAIKEAAEKEAKDKAKEAAKEAGK